MWNEAQIRHWLERVRKGENYYLEPSAVAELCELALESPRFHVAKAEKADRGFDKLGERLDQIEERLDKHVARFVRFDHLERLVREQSVALGKQIQRFNHFVRAVNEHYDPDDGA